MKIMTAKIKTKDEREQVMLECLIMAHKFEISVAETFGQDFNCPGICEWLTDKPVDTLSWLRLPHEPMYIEYPDMFTFNNGAYGLLLVEDDGVIQIRPIVIINGKVSFEQITIYLGIGRRIARSDFHMFNNPEKVYEAWRNNVESRSDGRVLAVLNGVCNKHTQDLIMSSIPVLLESLLYINSKGIGTTVNQPKVKKGIKRKSAFTDWTYKTLRVIKRGEDSEIVNKSRHRVPFFKRDSREHSVRGHIAIYTTERPLFGNPQNVGPIWISPHIRCRGTEGKVFKDYEII